MPRAFLIKNRHHFSDEKALDLSIGGSLHEKMDSFNNNILDVVDDDTHEEIDVETTDSDDEAPEATGGAAVSPHDQRTPHTHVLGDSKESLGRPEFGVKNFNHADNALPSPELPRNTSPRAPVNSSGRRSFSPVSAATFMHQLTPPPPPARHAPPIWNPFLSPPSCPPQPYLALNLHLQQQLLASQEPRLFPGLSTPFSNPVEQVSPLRPESLTLDHVAEASHQGAHRSQPLARHFMPWDASFAVNSMAYSQTVLPSYQQQVTSRPPTSSAPDRRKEGDPPRYTCDGCSKSYSTFSGLSKHKQFHCITQVKKSFSCKFCDKTYVSLGALKMHIRTHTLPCKCTLCGKAFSRPWLLQGHLRTHTGEKPFRCAHCARAFADRSNLRAHLQTHSDVKKYSCPTCTKTFSRMSLLIKHQDGGCGGGMVRR